MKLENLKEVVQNNKTYTDCLKQLGKPIKGGYIYALKKKIQNNNIDTSHFESRKETMQRLIKNNGGKSLRKKILTSDILIKNYKGGIGSNNIKKRLFKEGLKENVCELCGQDENWKGKKMSLILDHINGNNRDNRLKNLRIVCSNCDATLPTYKGRNSN